MELHRISSTSVKKKGRSRFFVSFFFWLCSWSAPPWHFRFFVIRLCNYDWKGDSLLQIMVILGWMLFWEPQNKKLRKKKVNQQQKHVERVQIGYCWWRRCWEVGSHYPVDSRTLCWRIWYKFNNFLVLISFRPNHRRFLQKTSHHRFKHLPFGYPRYRFKTESIFSNFD